MLHSQEPMATRDADGGFMCHTGPRCTQSIALQSELFPRMLERYHASGTMGAGDRIGLMRLAWDFTGSEFAGRHMQYEKFNGGASHVMKSNMFRCYDFKRATGMVDRALGLDDEQKRLTRPPARAGSWCVST